MSNLKYIKPYLLLLPAIIIGTLAMISSGVASSIWMQNILIWLVGTIVSVIFLTRNRNEFINTGNLRFPIIFIALLLLPFLFHGIDGVHRWLTFGPINIYIASMILPLFIIFLWKLAQNNRHSYTIGLIHLTCIILLFHPDAGQLTAFVCATSLIIWKTINTWTMKILNLSVFTGLTVISWINLDHLEPVPYVEDIIFLVADLGLIWFILGLLSLIFLIYPFLFQSKKNFIALSLGTYFLMSMIVTLLGNFPMPIIGYGISPIIGYLIAITWMNKSGKSE